jgi:hypothetical protein
MSGAGGRLRRRGDAAGVTDGLHPALDVDDAGRISLGVAGDQLPIAGTSRAALEGAPCGSPIAADDVEPIAPIPGQLELGGDA